MRIRYSTHWLFGTIVAMAGLLAPSVAEAKLIVISRPVTGVPGPANHLLISARDDRTGTVVSRSMLGSTSGGATSVELNDADNAAVAAVWEWKAGTRKTPGYPTAEVPKPPSASDSSTWEYVVISMFDDLYRCFYQGNYPYAGLGMNSNSIVDESVRKAGLEFRALVDLPQFSAAPYQKEWRSHRDPDLRHMGCSVSIGGRRNDPVDATGSTPIVVTFDPPWGSPYPNSLIHDVPWNPGCTGAFTISFDYDFETNFDWGHFQRLDTMEILKFTGKGSYSTEMTSTTHWAAFTDSSVLSPGFSNIEAVCY
jgi:hypothetical protein